MSDWWGYFDIYIYMYCVLFVKQMLVHYTWVNNYIVYNIYIINNMTINDSSWHNLSF